MIENILIAMLVGTPLYFGLIRNTQVFRYRQRVIERISRESRADILRGNYDWKWRYDTFSGVSYWAMVFKFWAPLGSFMPPEIRV